MLLRWIIRNYFKLSGWTLVGEKPPLKKYIFIVAPHTSQTDFIMGKMYCVMARLKPRFLIKKEAFGFPLGLILKALGGIPVDRSSKKRLAQDMISKFDSSEDFILVVTPEGTRKRVKRWKRGFHYIANEARVPVVLAFIDYKTKSLGIGSVFYTSDDYQSDIRQIKDFYEGMEGKHPGRFTTED